jgi:hypothetical protein
MKELYPNEEIEDAAVPAENAIEAVMLTSRAEGNEEVYI